MPINLKTVKAGKGTKLREPRDIFAALPDKPWPRLRPEQGEVLKTWYERRDESDLVIKQNTGGGKTLVGLLIAQSSLTEEVGPAVYLVPDTYLITQVVDAATEVGIAVTTDHQSEQFLTCQAILVATFERVVNGRSAFGVRGHKPVVPLGVVIVDDAHAALAAARHQFCPTLPASCSGYGELLKLFGEDLKRQSPKAYADLVSGDHSAPLRVPPKATQERADEALQILKKYGDSDDCKPLYFGWPFVADSLNMAVITFTQREVEIRTPCPQIDLIPAFSNARRRVYLTATLADEGVLVTELDAKPSSVQSPITPDRASDLGDRLILAPMSINPHLSEISIRKMAREFADGDRHGSGSPTHEPINVVVLVPSSHQAKYWDEYADETVTVKTMGAVIARLTAGEHVGVVVLVNKYDGVDLPRDACRLLIVDGIPTPLSGSEQRESSAITGSATYEARKVQRIEQGMGRGIRDLEDYCAVLLLSREAALTLRSPKLRALYSPATRAQIELSQQIADQIQDEGIAEIRNALDMFLERDEDWIAKSREAVADVEYDQVGEVSEIAIARRQAFNAAAAGNLIAAAEILRDGINTVTDQLEATWLVEELAGYLQLTDPIAAQRAIAKAREINPGVIKPDVAPAPRSLRGPALQGETAAAYLASQYNDAMMLRLSVGAIFDNIVWGINETAERAEQQFMLLGLHLGFASSRPEKEEDDGGPDNLWGLDPTTNAVIELKTEVSRNPPSISKTEAGQLLTSIAWDEKRNQHAVNRIAILVHPSNELHHKASLPPHVRIITETDLNNLRTDVLRFADELAAANGWTDPATVTEALQRNQLSAAKVISAHSSKVVPQVKRKK